MKNKSIWILAALGVIAVAIFGWNDPGTIDASLTELESTSSELVAAKSFPGDELPQRAESETVEAVDAPAQSQFITVSATDQKPLAGVLLSLRNNDQYTLLGTTDAVGLLVCDTPIASSVVIATLAGYCKEVLPLPADVNKNGQIVIQMNEGRHLRGQVLLPNGAPAPAGFFVISRTLQQRQITSSTELDRFINGLDSSIVGAQTQAQGMFEIRDLPADGKAILFAGGPGFLSKNQFCETNKNSFVTITVAELVGAWIQIVGEDAQPIPSNIPGIAMGGSVYPMPGVESYSDRDGRTILCGSIKGEEQRLESEHLWMCLNSNSDGEDVLIKVGSGQLGYEPVSVELKAESILTGFPSYQIVMKDLAEHRADLEFAFINYAIPVNSKASYLVDGGIMTENSLFSFDLKGESLSVVLPKVPVGEYPYYVRPHHEYALPNSEELGWTGTVTVQEPNTRLEINCALLGALLLRERLVSGKEINRRREYRFWPRDKPNRHNYLNPGHPNFQFDFFPEGEYGLELESPDSGTSPKPRIENFRIIAGQVTEVEIILDW